MKKFLCSLAMMCSVCVVSAQTTIIQSLQTDRVGEGKVTVHQDASITNLLGVRYVRSGMTDPQRTLKARGYRVQVYAGNNSRRARNEAAAVSEKVKENFPEMPVYTFFQPPRWLCRVGDFKSIEEAHVAMRQLKATKVFKEVTIVREQIIIPIE